jgi:hypothetical protein
MSGNGNGFACGVTWQNGASSDGERAVLLFNFRSVGLAKFIFGREVLTSAYLRFQGVPPREVDLR